MRLWNKKRFFGCSSRRPKYVCSHEFGEKSKKKSDQKTPIFYLNQRSTLVYICIKEIKIYKKNHHNLTELKRLIKVRICCFEQERKLGMFRSWKVEAEGLAGHAAARKSGFESRSENGTRKGNGSALAIGGHYIRYSMFAKFS